MGRFWEIAIYLIDYPYTLLVERDLTTFKLFQYSGIEQFLDRILLNIDCMDIGYWVIDYWSLNKFPTPSVHCILFLIIIDHHFHHTFTIVHIYSDHSRSTF